MAPTLPAPGDARHLVRRDVMAKADLKNLETGRVQIGRAILRCFALAGVSQKEAAVLLQRDPAQVQRWTAGSERPHVDAIFGVAVLRQPLIIALAEMVGAGVDVETTITIRRIA
jgi:hypothetical protein